MRVKKVLKTAVVSTMIAAMSITSVAQPLCDNPENVLAAYSSRKAAQKIIKKVNSKGILTYFNGKGELYLSDKVSAIDTDALNHAKVTAFRVNPANPYLMAINGVLYTKSGTKIVRYPNASKTETYVMPEGVKTICYGAFKGAKVKNVVLPQSLTNIGRNAFRGCRKLESINIPNNIGVIRENTFLNCQSLKKITLSKGIEKVGYDSFSGCTNLTEITFLSGTANIKNYAFDNCEKLEKVNVKNGLKKIGNYAFRNCKRLQSIKFGKKLERIGGYAFYNCHSLKSVHIPGNVDIIEDAAFCNCQGLQVVSIADGVETINEEAFQGCTQLTNVNLPNSITEISNSMFYGCTSLKKISIPKSVKAIYPFAFASCKSLTEISIPNSVTKISNSVFKNCLSLCKIKLPEKLEKIEQYTFYNCDSLEDINLPNSVDTIKYGAYANCDKLKNIKITKNVTSIGEDAFCKTGERYIVDAANPVYASIDGALCDASKSILLKYPAHKAGNYKTPDSVDLISDSAFTNCDKLKVVEIGEKVTRISQSICEDSSIEKLILPKTLKHVDYNRYTSSSNNLKAVEIPAENKDYFTKDGVLYSSEGTMKIYPKKREGTITFPYNFNNVNFIPMNNCASKFQVAVSGGAIYKNDDCVITNKKKTKVLAFPGKMKVYTMGEKMKDATAIYYNKQYLQCFKKYVVNKKNEKYWVKNGMLYIENTLVDCPNGKKGTVVLGKNTDKVKYSAFSYTTGVSQIVFKKHLKSMSITLDNSKVKTIKIAEGDMRSITIDDAYSLKELNCPNSLIRTYINKRNKNLVIKAWSNTKIEEYAKKNHITFKSKGYVPSKVRNVKIIGYANEKYAVFKWTADPNVTGYELTIDNKVVFIKNNEINRKNIYLGDRSRIVMEIRSYKIQNGKKIFGKARTIVYRNY